jgi:hypothetical protein
MLNFFRLPSVWLYLPVFLILSFLNSALAVTMTNDRLSVGMENDGGYHVTVKASGWNFAGKLPAPAQDVKQSTGEDAVGSYRQIAFSWSEATHAMTGTIRLYDAKDVILFSDTTVQAIPTPAAPFPNFTTLPTGLFPFSYRDISFADPQHNLKTTSSPWLFFDAQDHAFLISAASHFLITTLIGDGQTQIASVFNDKLINLPADFSHQTIMALGNSINATYDLWGHALTDLQGKKRPANDADPLLKYFGYWTDNGADYYYGYDSDKGYAGTLQALVDSYRQQQIPLHYLQLDSWWYHKTFTDPDGVTQGKTKNDKLPEGDWNRYGGLIEYTPAPFLFPDGLEAFHKTIKLPFVTHIRWIDAASPYHQRFQISGIAAVDPKFWDEITAFMKANDIIILEQDWLNEIFEHSPEFSSTVDKGDAFLDNMVRACREQGATIQYCMALPRCFLQASKYDNVTTIRTSGDRFAPNKYRSFLFASRFAISMGVWPWADVFKSREIDNLLLCNLSAGPVGTGDALGKESKVNIFQTIRADGVIIKPDQPLLPIDAAYVAEAQKQDIPLVACTSTDHDGLKTIYAVAIRKGKSLVSNFTISPSDLGINSPAYFHDYFAGTGMRLEKDKPLTGQIDASGVSYYVIAPVGSSGIAFLGDKDKFVSAGKQRVASLKDGPDDLNTEILLAPSEDQVTLHGYADKAPQVTVPNGTGTADPVQYDAATHHFIVTLRPSSTLPLDTASDPVRHLWVTFKKS